MSYNPTSFIEAPAKKTSPWAIIGIVVFALLLIGGIGGTIWYLLARNKSPAPYSSEAQTRSITSDPGDPVPSNGEPASDK